MASDPVLLVNEDDPKISIVTLNRPQKRNALSLELIDRITEAAISASNTPARRVLILQGSGPSFCAGLDLQEAAVPGGAEKSAEALARMYAAIGNSPLVTIAAAHGAAMGGGAGLLAACDFVVAADDLKIAYPEVRRGLVAALVTCLLRRRLNDGAVRELILLGQSVQAERAAWRWDWSVKWCRWRICRNPRSNWRARRRAAHPARSPGRNGCWTTLPGRWKKIFAVALRVHLSARNSAEAAEGIAAFTEKREPRWGPRSTET